MLRGYNKGIKRISIHAAREGGDECAIINFVSFAISIHAAREGGDGRTGCTVRYIADFNPRRP